MRMGFGLVGLLVVVAIMVYMSSKSSEAPARAQKEVRREMTQVTGRAPDGGAPIDKSAEFAATPAGLSVTAVVAGGYFEQFYDLKKDDVIVEAGSSGSLKGVDDNSATAFLFTAAQSKQPLKILRGGQPKTLDPITPK